MIRRPPRSTQSRSSAASDVYKRQFDGLFDRIAAHDDAGEAVCVLASGDPGFFGIVRMLDERFGADRLAVHPAPSSVALAFAAMGRTWDDAVIASAHGRPLPPAVRAVLHAPKAAVLTSPDNPPEAVGPCRRLREACRGRRGRRPSG